jgi:hypothetical protein
MIENAMGTVRRRSCKPFRRLKAFKQLPALRAALKAKQNARSPGALFANPTPLNIIFCSGLARGLRFCVRILRQSGIYFRWDVRLYVLRTQDTACGCASSVKPACLQIRNDQPDHENLQR